MVTLKEKKLASMGPDVILIIPRQYIKDNILDPNKLYDITIEEAKKKKTEEE